MPGPSDPAPSARHSDSASPAREDALRGFRRLCSAALALTLALVALGGAVRSTGSGLACPDWPLCYGKVIPRQADIPPETGYTLWNVWLEHTHRLVATLVGLLVAALVLWALARFRQPRILLPTLVAGVAVVVQAGLGALVVLMLLQAELVTAHLALAMVVVALLAYLALTAGRPRRSGPRSGLAWLSLAVAALALAQIVLGGHVTGIAAGLVYTEFPQLGEVAYRNPTVDQQVSHIAHRALAFVLLGGVVWLCAHAVGYRRSARRLGVWEETRQRWLVMLPMWAATLIVIQIGLGVSNLLFRTPPAVVAAHLMVASWIWTLLVLQTVLAARYAPVPERVADRSDPAVRQASA